MLTHLLRFIYSIDCRIYPLEFFYGFFLLKDSKKRGKRIQYLISKHSIKSAFCYTCIPAGRGTQRQFSARDYKGYREGIPYIHPIP